MPFCRYLAKRLFLLKEQSDQSAPLVVQPENWNNRRKSQFLIAYTRLYNLLCRLVCLSVGSSVCQFIRLSVYSKMVDSCITAPGQILTSFLSLPLPTYTRLGLLSIRPCYIPQCWSLCPSFYILTLSIGSLGSCRHSVLPLANKSNNRNILFITVPAHLHVFMSFQRQI